MKPNRIIFADDFLYPEADTSIGDEYQASFNFHLARNALGRDKPEISVQLLEDLIATTGTREKFYLDCGADLTRAGWAKVAHSQPSGRNLALLKDIFSDSLVIGFTLPQMVKQGLERLAIPYLDFIPHPADFLEETAFLVSGNVNSFDLSPWVISEQEIQRQATLLKSRRAKQLPKNQKREDIAVFVCQPESSRLRWNRDGLIRIEDFQDEMFAIIRKHDHLLVFRDGYEEPERADLFFTQLCPKTSLYEGDFYDLMAMPEVSAVYGINSKKVLTAIYFDKAAKGMEKNWKHIPRIKMKQGMASIKMKFADINFLHNYFIKGGK